MLEYLTIKEAAEKWGVTSRMVTYYCTSQKIDGSIKKGDIWLIPSNVEKPMDGRTIEGRMSKNKGGDKSG